MSILQIVSQILVRITDAIGIVQRVLSTLITSGWYIVVQDAAMVTTDIHVLLEDPTCGQEAQCTKLDTIITDLGSLASALAMLGDPQQTGSPVTLPTVPPSGYGAPSTSANAAAVWAFVSTDEGTQMGFIMSALSVYLRVLRDSLQLPMRLGDHFYLNFDCFSLVNDPTTSFVGDSANEILPTDLSVGDWLARIEPHYTWHQGGNGSWWADLSGGGGEAIVTCTLTEQEFLWFRAAASGTLPGPIVPPVWPGLANVTYGAPQSMDAPNGTLTGPADGYKIEIDAQPGWAGKFDFGSVQAWRNVGAIAFLDDETIPEPAQTLGFASVIYTPQRMAHSSGALYRIATGYHATATPYVINS